MRILRYLALKLFTPIIHFMGRFGNPEPAILSDFVHNCMKELVIGDILLAKVNFHPSNMFIAGYWPHVAILGEHKMVIEADGVVVRKVPLQEWLFKKDHVLVRRVPRATMSERITAGCWAAGQLGKKYDEGFMPDNKEFYCSELVADAWNAAIPHIFKFTKGMGVETILPQDLAETKMLETILKTN